MTADHETPQTAPEGDRSRYWLGIGIALLSSTGFAFNVTMVSLAYRHGANVHSVNLVRVLLFTGCLFAVLSATGRDVMLPRRERWTALALGILMGAQLYALLGALSFIPVGLTILVMYTYPLAIAIFAWLSGRESFSIAGLLALVAAFAGLGLALQVPAGALDWRGGLLAGLAALGLATVLVISEPLMRGRDNRVIMLHMMVTTSAILSVLVMAGVDLTWPKGPVGWLAFAGASVFFVVATFCLFTAVSLIGPLKTAVIDMGSPIWAILFALALLGETLTGTQAAGALLVLGAILFVQLRAARGQRGSIGG